MTEYTSDQNHIQIDANDVAHVLPGVTIGTSTSYYDFEAIRMEDGSRLILDGVVAVSESTYSKIGVYTKGASQIDIGETGSIQASWGIEAHGQLLLHNDGSITSGGSSLVIFDAGNSMIENNGSITASGGSARGVEVFGSRKAENVQTIVNTGQITASTALYVSGGGTFRLVNSGLIEGETGIKVQLSPILQSGDNPEWWPSISEISNSGTIIGSKYAFYTESGAALRINNSGLIVGSMNFGWGLHTLLNSGRIEGDIVFSGRFSSYDGRNGFASGTIDLGYGDGTAYGGAGNETILGGDGRDFIDGGAGADQMAGGRDDDIYIVDDVGDVIIEASGEGKDTVLAHTSYVLSEAAVVEVLRAFDADATTSINLVGSTSANTIIGNAGSNFLDGQAGADSLSGGAGSDTLAGGAGDDTLDGGADADQMAGGFDNDTYYVDSSGDEVSESAHEGIDTVYTTISYALNSSAEVEVLRTTSTSATTAINLTGSDTANTLHGNAGVNRLDGRAGADKMYGYGGNDIYFVDNAEDEIIEFTDGGTDTIFASVSYDMRVARGVEVLRTTNSSATTAINLTGNSASNTIMGNAGPNRLDGKARADKMYGYGGNDIYFVDDADDKVVETASGGAADLVYSSVSYTLASHVEKLYAYGSSPISLTGNTLANAIKGNASVNKINGGLGNDTLYGGAGRDIFVFNTKPSSSNIDRIADYNVQDDIIYLENAVFTKLGFKTETWPKKLSVSAFWTGSKAHDASDRIIYDPVRGHLYYDADGTGASKQVLIATLAKNLEMTYAEFAVM